jgi:hypothetical protein
MTHAFFAWAWAVAIWDMSAKARAENLIKSKISTENERELLREV